MKQHTRERHPVEQEPLIDVKDPKQRASAVENRLKEKGSNQVEEVKQALMWRSIFVTGTVDINTVAMAGGETIEPPSFLRSNFQEDEIDTILQHYWTHFHPFFPLVHRPTFDHRTANSLLVNAMSAVGALYSPQLKIHSSVLCENTLKSIYESISIGGASIQFIQAALILTFYGTYTDRIWCKGSRTLHTQLVAVARETGIFQSNPHDEFGDEWGSFIASEGRKRTSSCLYMLDSQMATLLNYPPSLSHYEVKHVLPCSDELWEAATASEWRSLCSSTSTQVIQFLPALQQTLMYRRCPKQMSSFGSLTILLAIHVMIRNMAQYAGILEVPAIYANDPFSRRSQLGEALNALRTLIPKKKSLQSKGGQKSMWEMFIATWNLAYIHLHFHDPVITSGIVEVTLPASIAIAAALAKPHPVHSPENSILGNNFSFVPFETLLVVVNHVCYFLRLSADLCTEDTVEKSPVFTFMFYKASLVAWQILNSDIHSSRIEEEEKSEKGSVETAYIRRRLIDDIMNCVDDDDSDENDADELERFEIWMRNVLSSANTWSVGLAASASFYF